MAFGELENTEWGAENRMMVLFDENRALVETKLDEYVERLAKTEKKDPDLSYRIDIGEKLLAENQVNPDLILAELKAKYGDSFNERAFINAWAVLKEYSRHGGKNLKQRKSPSPDQDPNITMR